MSSLIVNPPKCHVILFSDDYDYLYLYSPENRRFCLMGAAMCLVAFLVLLSLLYLFCEYTKPGRWILCWLGRVCFDLDLSDDYGKF